MKKLVIFWFCLSFTTILTYAQTEICNDGIDNDGDGFIDCFDKKCGSNSACDGTFLGNDALCQAKPTAFPKFTMTLDFASPNETTNHLSRMAIGDLDRDGIPEIITMNRYTKKVFILDGRNGSVKHSVDAPFEPQWEIAIANLDDDNCAEIFTFGREGKKFFLYGYNCDLSTQLWKTEIIDDPINFGLADFNGDGTVELYAKDEIFDAKTGKRLVKSNNWGSLNGGPTAVDIEGDANLELIVGCIIYSVDLGTGAADSGSLTELKRVPNYFIRYEYNATSVADYNLDGFLDVIASGSTVKKGKNTTIFFWDVKNNVVKTFFDNSAGAYLPNGWDNGTGRLNIADLDGDGKMNVSYVSGKFLYALDENLDLFWRKVINEETSGYTGCTLFDFNGDGKSEIVYRDEQFLYIINGTDGSIYNQQNCVSRTNREYPIVADVDADGSTEMCVPCGFNDKDALDNFDDIEYSQFSHVRVFKSAAEPWVPARRLWNQHGYFNVNVNDDLTIPRRQQKHHLVFSSGSCTQGPNRPLNGFLNQSPYLNSDGCPTYASPDLAYVDNSLTVKPPTCPNGNFQVTFQITNKGDVPLDGQVPITFYNGDPTKAGATKLNTVTTDLSSFGPGAVSSVTNATVKGPGGPFTLYIVLNDGGTTVPTPIVLPNTNFVECDYGNNIISAPINPLPVSLSAVKVSDNSKCIGSTTPDNGAVRAFIPNGATQNTTDYKFFWFKGTTVDATPDFIGALYSGIAEGDYTVYAVHKTAQCSSDTVRVTVLRTTGPLIVNVTLIAPNTDCKNPNGSLKATADSGGQPASAFTFAWYQGNDIFTSPQIGVNDVATNLKALTYTVLVTEKLSGCQTVNSFTVPDNTVKPIPTTTKTDILCSGASTGSVSAKVGTATAGFKFEWYNGSTTKPTVDFTGAVYGSRPGGNYTVVVTNNGTKCVSDPVTVTVIQTTKPVVTAVKVSDMTSCDSTQPNGTATASVPGGPTGFTFEWFKGPNTQVANKVGTGTSINSLKVGTYTVKVTDDATGCSGTNQVSITFNVVTPTMTSAVVPVTTCTPFNGSITMTPSVDTPADYTFSWYNGTAVKPATDYTVTGNQLPNLPAGDYTVQAVNNIRHCNVAPVTVKVLDNSPAISIVLNSSITVLPSDCASSDGVMSVDVSSPANTTAGFKIEWYFGRMPFTGPILRTDNAVFSSTATGLKTGVYSVVATDLISGCGTTKDFNLPFANAHEIQFVSKVDVTTCVPGNEGSAVVKLIPSPDNPPIQFDEDDYDISVYSGTNDPGVGGTPIETIAGVLGQANYATTIPQTAGMYTYVGISKHPQTFGCRSVPILVEIKKNTTDPAITVTTLSPNTNCIGVTGSGQITVAADASNPANYTFDWFNGPTIASPSLASGGVNGEQVSSLMAGPYTVRVTNNTATSTGCFSIRTIDLGDNPQQVDIDPTGLTTANLMACTLATGAVINNGSATVTAITEDGAPGNLADYAFKWTDVPGAVLQSGPSPSLINLGAGVFFVDASNTVTKCFTDLEFEILDNTIGTTNVTLTAFENPEKCIAPKNGSLTVTASGSSVAPTPYNFEWYAGTLPTGPVIDNTNDLQGITIPTGTTVNRTIKVINNTNNCWAVDTYVVTLIINEVQATISASPLTSCISPDGSVFGTVTNDNSLDYNYTWSIGPVAKASPDFTGKLVSNLSAGVFTMVATDILDATCKSSPQTAEVLDSRVIPVVTTQLLSPVTNCDPAKANGGATAAVGGNVANYIFDWWVGSGTTGAPFFTGAEAGGLSAGPYTVQATDMISGCTGLGSVEVLLNLLPIPAPTIDVLSQVTSCVTANGALSVSVDGNTQDYIFNWYKGSAPTSQVDYVGEIIDSLAVGTYTVTATSRITGCTSAPVSQPLIKQQTFPDFDFKIIPASCDNDNGFASLIMSSNVPIQSIEWIANGGIVEGPNLSEIGAGTYTVTVVSELGCATTKDVDIGTEIRPYNGVSRNGDGRNEIFNISCIENFPGNNVKIFNRAGTMVYEGTGYDNVEIYFDGKSNRGISPMGSHLPDGTYYYVIDKRDGSKPLAGYLELVK